jgi:hypothetical protein
MSVLVQMVVRPPDWAAFASAMEWMDGQGMPKGLHSSR